MDKASPPNLDKVVGAPLTLDTMDQRDLDAQEARCRNMSRGARALWASAGTISLALGMIGIAVPLLPTTPFLLIAAACYARSSPRMYRWIMCNRVVGSYIQGYMEGKGVPWRAKAVSITLLWAVIGVSVTFFVDSSTVRIVMLAVAVLVTFHIATVGPRKGYTPR